MGKQELDNLVQIGKLKAEAPSRKEFDGMLASARRGLVDAQNESIETDSQFDLAYGAAHRFALAQAFSNRLSRAIQCYSGTDDPNGFSDVTVRIKSAEAKTDRCTRLVLGKTDCAQHMRRLDSSRCAGRTCRSRQVRLHHRKQMFAVARSEADA
jgi:hypothetical protein